MARDKALYAGHAVAAVAATSAKIAARGPQADRGRLRGPALGHRRRRGAAAGRAHPARAHARQGRAPSRVRPRHPTSPASSSTSWATSRPGFAAAEVVVERSFKTKPVHQGYIEPHACLVSVTKDGHATIWSSSQGHFMVRDMTAQLTGTKLSDIRAIPAEIGGGFGGKTIVYLEPLALVLASKSGRPVKMVMTREEVFRATGPTSGSSSTVKIGATKDGKITAVKATYRLQAGAFPGSPIRGAVGCALSPYDIANVQITGFDVVTNRPKVAAYRAPGAPIGAFSMECTLDDLARALKMDPLVLRQKNAAKEGTKAAYGPTFRRIGYEETLQAALDHPALQGAARAPTRAAASPAASGSTPAASRAPQVNVNEDGTVVVVTGHPDIGGSRASMVNIVAEAARHRLSPGAGPDRRHELRRLQRADRRQPRHVCRRPWW